MSRLARVARQAEDLLLVYYAGHGLRHETKDVLYLTVQDTAPDNLAASAVSFELVKEAIEASSARTRVVILDVLVGSLVPVKQHHDVGRAYAALAALQSTQFVLREVEQGRYGLREMIDVHMALQAAASTRDRVCWSPRQHRA